MKHTEHYQLSQFEADDRILREDFNADNAKIEQALAVLNTSTGNLASSKADASALTAEIAARQAGDCMVKLIDYTSTASTSNLSIDMSGIDLTNYTWTWLTVDLPQGTSATMSMLLNNLTSNYTSCKMGSSQTSPTALISSSANQMHALLRAIPYENHIACIYALLESGSFEMYYTRSGVSPAELTTLNFVTGGGYSTIPAGAHVTLVGFKR